jgi:hypothetical protein
MVRYREPPLSERVEGRISARFPSDDVMRVFMGYDKRAARTPDDVAEATFSPSSCVRRATRWLREKRYIAPAGSRGFRISAGYRTHVTSVTAIEAKLSDWSRVIEQARRAASFAHYAYVAVDADRVSVTEARLALLRKLNIGLILVHEATDPEVVGRPSRVEPFSELLSMRINEEHFHRWRGVQRYVRSTPTLARGRSGRVP